MKPQNPVGTGGPRLPAEYEDQHAVLLAFPHGRGDWAPWLDQVQSCYVGMIRRIAVCARVIVMADDAPAVQARLLAAGVKESHLHVQPLTFDDTWIRDYGPITTVTGGRPTLLDFGFNGWGLKYPSPDDNQATRRLHAAGVFGQAPLATQGLILEGGSIESDGRGTILTTSACLLSPNRNPHLDRTGIEAELARTLGATRVLWLEHGHLEGDDTDAHVDTIVRLCPDDTIAYVSCDDPTDSHYQEFAALAAELRALRTADGRPYRLVPLPWAAARHDADDGHRLPATYANFLIINGTVLVPTYDEPARDAAAVAAVRTAFPGWTVDGVDCSALILQHGSLHCATMQVPPEVWSWNP